MVVATLSERVAAKTDASGGHHRWLGAAGADGTPQIRVEGRLTTVRRVVWEQAHGPLPTGETVAACPAEARCVRLEHLSLGRKDRAVGPSPSNAPRRRRGAGSAREVRPGVWELSISDAGTRRYRTVQGTRDDATSALALFVAEITGCYDRLEELIVAYLAHLEAQGRSPTTTRRYRALWRNWLSPALASYAPSAIRPPELERSLVVMADAGQSRSSIHQAAILISGCFAWARRQGTVGTNPAIGLRLPDGTRLAAPRRVTNSS